MFAEDVSWVEDAVEVVDRNELSSNSLMNMMKGYCIVVLVKLGMKNGHTIHDGLVIAKHVTTFMNGNT